MPPADVRGCVRCATLRRSPEASAHLRLLLPGAPCCQRSVADAASGPARLQGRHFLWCPERRYAIRQHRPIPRALLMILDNVVLNELLFRYYETLFATPWSRSQNSEVR